MPSSVPWCPRGAPLPGPRVVPLPRCPVERPRAVWCRAVERVPIPSSAPCPRAVERVPSYAVCRAPVERVPSSVPCPRVRRGRASSAPWCRRAPRRACRAVPRRASSVPSSALWCPAGALCRIPVYRGDVARRLPAWLGHPNHGGHFGPAKRYGSGIITDCKFRQFREPAPPAAGQRVGSGGRVANRPSAPEISYGSGIITAGNFPLKQSPAPSA